MHLENFMREISFVTKKNNDMPSGALLAEPPAGGEWVS